MLSNGNYRFCRLSLPVFKSINIVARSKIATFMPLLPNCLKKDITVLDSGCGPATWTFEVVLSMDIDILRATH